MRLCSQHMTIRSLQGRQNMDCNLEAGNLHQIHNVTQKIIPGPARRGGSLVIVILDHQGLDRSTGKSRAFEGRRFEGENIPAIGGPTLWEKGNRATFIKSLADFIHHSRHTRTSGTINIHGGTQLSYLSHQGPLANIQA